MNVALDFCSNRMKSLYFEEEFLKSRSIRCAFSILPNDAEIRDALRQLKIPFAIQESRLIVYGDYAHRAGKMFGSPVLPLFPQGNLPRTDPVRRQLVSHLLDLLLPKSTGDNGICMMTAPGGWNIEGSEFRSTTEYLKRLVRLKNFEPIIVNAGLASAFAELGTSRFTGLCLTIGETHSHGTLLLQAREVLSFSIPQATQWLLQEIARKTECHIWNRQGEKLLDVDGVSEMLSSSQWIDSGISKEIDSSLNHLLRHLVQQITANSNELNEETKKELKSISLPVVVTGDLVTMIPTLETSVVKALDYVKFPFEVERVKISEKPEHSVTRGCLICAELEQNSQVSQAA